MARGSPTTRSGSREDFEAIFCNPEITVHMREAEKLAMAYEPHLYEVAFTHVIA
jgi:hypothetical protein